MTYKPFYFIFAFNFSINGNKAVIQLYMVRTNFGTGANLVIWGKYNRTCGLLETLIFCFNNK